MKKDRIVSPYENFGVFASFWLWGLLLFVAPNYLSIIGGWKIVFIVLGFIAIIISFTGMCFEFAKLFQNKGLEYLATFVLFALPALIIHLALTHNYLKKPVISIIAKIAVLLLVSVGGAVFLVGIPYLFWMPKSEQEFMQAEKSSVKEASKSEMTKGKTTLKAIATIVIILLNLATAIIKLIIELI